MLNVVALAGERTDAGVKIASLPRGQPEATWTLVLEEPRKDGQHWKRFLPVVAYGDRGEALAASLKAGNLMTVQGRLCWRTPPPTKSEPKLAGRLDERDMGPSGVHSEQCRGQVQDRPSCDVARQWRAAHAVAPVGVS